MLRLWLNWHLHFNSRPNSTPNSRSSSREKTFVKIAQIPILSLSHTHRYTVKHSCCPCHSWSQIQQWKQIKVRLIIFFSGTLDLWTVKSLVLKETLQRSIPRGKTTWWATRQMVPGTVCFLHRLDVQRHKRYIENTYGKMLFQICRFSGHRFLYNRRL